eukprot:m.372641 g.372641  ORF g.372641 m.372641 type:complete len:56 (+) comp63800_c0_seq1:89-256(+)
MVWFCTWMFDGAMACYEVLLFVYNPFVTCTTKKANTHTHTYACMHAYPLQDNTVC